jgi:hypothetical protein
MSTLVRFTAAAVIIISVFGSVTAVAFQIAFRVEIHANDIFFIFLKSFLTSAHQNNPKSTNYTQF